MLIDTHVHLQHPEYGNELHAILARAAIAGVEKMVVASYDLSSSREAVKIAEEVEACYATVGIHPHAAKDVSREMMEELERLASSSRVAAVGETGLDYHYMHSSKAAQLASLEAHLELCERQGKPIIIHDREAHDDMLTALEGFPVNRLGGVWHCFSGDLLLAEKIMAKVSGHRRHSHLFQRVGRDSTAAPAGEDRPGNGCPLSGPGALQGAAQ